MTGLFYSSYQMVCLFLLNILENNLEKTRQDNIWCLIVLSTWTVLPSKPLKEPTCRFSYFIIMHGSADESSFFISSISFWVHKFKTALRENNLIFTRISQTRK